MTALPYRQHCFLAPTALLLVLAVAASCTQTPADADDAAVAPVITPQPSPTPESEALLVGGFIMRDDETRRLIEETAEVSLPSGVGPQLRFEVRKSRYRLEVWQDQQRRKVYPVALGSSPTGAKERAGDHRTPEGTYLLRPHHPSPSFGGCFYLCYPNEHDVRRGLDSGLIGLETAERVRNALRRDRLPPYDTKLGGLILIHGTKDRSSRMLTTYNWTLGCIAMENRDIIELLAAFAPTDRPQVRIWP